jgi:hypothetical protein
MVVERPVMYLEHEDWSPRYEDTFFTVRLDRFKLFASLPDAFELSTLLPDADGDGDGDGDDDDHHTVGGKTNFPAYYYEIEVFCGRHEPRIVFRRYSQFKWLYEKLPKNLTNGSIVNERIVFPPGSPCLCHSQNDEFAKNRSEQLSEFLKDALTRKGVASQEFVAEFLELDLISSR